MFNEYLLNKDGMEEKYSPFNQLALKQLMITITRISKQMKLNNNMIEIIKKISALLGHTYLMNHQTLSSANSIYFRPHFL